MAKREIDASTPAEVRAQIGTPAGESPAKDRKRLGTECLTDFCPPGGDLKRVKLVEDPEDFEETQDEISTTGGSTGTKVASPLAEHNPAAH